MVIGQKFVTYVEWSSPIEYSPKVSAKGEIKGDLPLSHCENRWTSEDICNMSTEETEDVVLDVI